MRGVGSWGGWLVFTCPRWPFRSWVCDSQSTSSSTRCKPVVPQRSNLTPSQLPNTGEERADGSLHASDRASESWMSVVLFPGPISRWQPLVSFTICSLWKTKASETKWWNWGGEEVWIWNKILKDLWQSVWQHHSPSWSLLHAFRSFEMKNSTEKLFYESSLLVPMKFALFQSSSLEMNLAN